MSAVFIIYVVQIGMSFAIPILGIRLLIKNPRNQINRVFALITLLVFFWLSLDAFNRILFTTGFYISDNPDIPLRFSEVFMLLAGLFLINFANIFPGRGGALTNRKGDNTTTGGERRNRLNPILFFLFVITAALSLLTLTDYFTRDGSYDVVSKVYVSSAGPVYYLNRLFILLCMLLAIQEQRRFILFHERDPRRIHSRYLIYAIVTGAVLIGVLYLLTFVYPIQNYFYSGLAFLFLLGTIFIYKILTFRSIGLRGGLYRNTLFLLFAAIPLLPAVLLINYLTGILYQGSPWVLALTLCFFFILFHFLYLRLQPFLSHYIFRNQERIDESLTAYNNSILTLNSDETSDAQSGLVEYLNNLYQPRFLVFYTLLEQSGEEQTIELHQDRNLTRIADVESIPPHHFPEELLGFLDKSARFHQDGGLLVDIQAIADSTENTNASRTLSQFASYGAEVILPFYEHARNKGGEQNKKSQGEPERLFAVLILGLARNGRPLDHTDWRLLMALRGPTLLAIKNQELLLSTARLQRKLEEENKKITSRLSRNLPGVTQGGSAAAFVYEPGGSVSQIMEQVEKFAQRDSPVLITGETGTGKEQVARMMHAISDRSGALITVNCSAIPEDLIENELFGHARGAYTGATESSEGLVDRAAGGTLFLDEIGEMPLQGQVKLLRLVQEGEFEKIGSNETIKTDARFVFATNRDLERECNQGTFRSDLYYRISTFEIRVPPLRERKEDLPLLLDHFLTLAGNTFDRHGLKLTDAARELLVKHNWPGNVRELENLILRTVVLSDSSVLDVDSLPVMFKDEVDFSRKQLQLEKIQLEQARLEKELLLEALEQSRGNQRRAAEILKISRGSLQYRMKQYGLVQR